MTLPAGFPITRHSMVASLGPWVKAGFDSVALALKEGRLPLWEPGLFGGYPLFADGEVGMLYPLHLLAYGLLPPDLAFAWLRPISELIVQIDETVDKDGPVLSVREVHVDGDGDVARPQGGQEDFVEDLEAGAQQVRAIRGHLQHVDRLVERR